MKTILYASVSANGYVVLAGGEHEIRADILADFLGRVRTAGNIVMGRRTFDLMRSGGSGDAFAGIDIVVLSSRNDSVPGVHVVGSPEEALHLLDERGHAAALLGGGAATDNAFLARDLVDELCVNITPVLTGRGQALSLPDDRSADLQLLDTRRLADDIVQLHHQVCR